MKPWNPETHPYRVSSVYRSSSPGCYGWRYGPTNTFETLDEARAHAATIKGAKSVRIDVAQNAATWCKNGRWKKVEV